MAKGKYEKWLEADNLILLEAWARDGLTQEQIARNMGISLSTFKEWRNKHPAISAALKKGKELADYIMENALYRRGTGYTVKLRKPMKVREIEYDNGKKVKEKEEIVYAEEEVHIPPDTTAQIFWLKNRKPEVWRDKRDVQPTSGEDAEDDGFIDALKEQAPEIFKNTGIVETISEKELEKNADEEKEQ